MKNISRLLAVLCVALVGLSTNQAFANIKSGSIIYLKPSGEWGCHASYFIFLSGENKSFLMTPVAGMPGLYQFTAPKDIQDNLRFCYSDTEFSTDQQGQVGTHTEDITGWSVANPCLNLSDTKTKWSWGPKSAGDVGTMSITDLNVTLETSCADSTFNVIITVTFEGEPCSLDLTGTQMRREIKRVSPSSPFTYTIRGLDATEATGAQSVTAKLCSDGAGKSVVAEKTQTYKTPDFTCEIVHEQETVCKGETRVFQATTEGKAYLWSTGATTEQISIVFAQDTTIWCRVFDTIRQAKNNLMVNGGFEDEIAPTSGFHSDYKYAGFDVAQYYENPTVGPDNLFGITHDANFFWRDFASIEPHGGNYYAIFDAGKSGKAWVAETDQVNTNLKVLKDSIYIFSYWAAYPNKEAYNNPAILQFSITYIDENGQQHTELLGTEVFLGMDEANLNEWEYHEVRWKAPCTSNYLSISVEDHNNVHDGNDFCLDDIMFQCTSYAKQAMIIQDTYPFIVKNCAELSDTICLGETYTGHGFNVTPTHAGDTIITGAQGSLELHVVDPIALNAEALNPICNHTGGTIDIPFTLVSGQPVTYSMTADNADVTPVTNAPMPTNGVFEVSIPSAILSGERHVTFTFMNKEKRCNDFQLPVTITFWECKELKDTTCVGHPYDKDGFKHPADAVGTFKVENGTTNVLYLTVLPNPEVQVESITQAECDVTSAEVDIPYQIIAGANLPYQLTFDKVLSPMNGVLDNKPFHVLIPTEGLNTIITGTLTYTEEERCTGTSTFTVYVSNGVVPIYRKWDNVLFVSNEKDEFIAYQWYRDNQPISGATEQALYTGKNKMQGDNHSYSVIVTRLDGTTEQSCEYVFEKTTPSAPLNPGERKAVQARKVIYQVGPAMQIIETTYEDGTTDIQKVIAL